MWFSATIGIQSCHFFCISKSSIYQVCSLCLRHWSHTPCIFSRITFVFTHFEFTSLLEIKSFVHLDCTACAARDLKHTQDISHINNNYSNNDNISTVFKCLLDRVLIYSLEFVTAMELRRKEKIKRRKNRIVFDWRCRPLLMSDLTWRGNSF